MQWSDSDAGHCVPSGFLQCFFLEIDGALVGAKLDGWERHDLEHFSALLIGARHP